MDHSTRNTVSQRSKLRLFSRLGSTPLRSTMSVDSDCCRLAGAG